MGFEIVTEAVFVIVPKAGFEIVSTVSFDMEGFVPLWLASTVAATAADERVDRNSRILDDAALPVRLSGRAVGTN